MKRWTARSVDAGVGGRVPRILRGGAHRGEGAWFYGFTVEREPPITCALLPPPEHSNRHLSRSQGGTFEALAWCRNDTPRTPVISWTVLDGGVLSVELSLLVAHGVGPMPRRYGPIVGRGQDRSDWITWCAVLPPDRSLGVVYLR